MAEEKKEDINLEREELKESEIPLYYNPENYFITRISTNLVCNEDTVVEIYKEPLQYLPHPDNTENYDLILSPEKYEKEHDEYANQLQLYYTLLKKPVDPLPDAGRLINIRNLTPILIQRTEGILSTLLFITLDQNHDFRGGRTAGSDSWVTVKKPTFVSKVKSIDETTNIPLPMSNSYLNTLVNTSFSGLNSLIGLLIIDDEHYEALSSTNTKYFDTKTKKIKNEIMELFDSITFNTTSEFGGFNIYMNGCSPDGNNEKLDGMPITFLSFAQSTWDHGMHNIWTFDKKKHIYLVQLKSLTATAGLLQPDYSVFEYTIIENIVPNYECYYNSAADENNNFLNYLKENGIEYAAGVSDEELENYYNALLGYLKLTGVGLQRGAVLRFHL